MKLPAIAVACLLAGCASNPCPAPTVVKVPVPVPCHAPAVQRPAFAFAQVPPAADIKEQVRGLLVEREQRAGYESQLEAALGACR